MILISLFSVSCSQPIHTVKFDSNGGSAIDDQPVEDGKCATRPTNPTKVGFAFDDWYTDTSFSTKYDFNTPVKSDFTLYAKWTQVPVKVYYTVTFASRGGTSVPDQSVEAGKCATEPTAPKKAGFTFKGWYTDLQATKNLYDFSTPVTADLKLYAGWKVTGGGGGGGTTYTITYKPGEGASGTVKTVQVAEGAYQLLANTQPSNGTKDVNNVEYTNFTKSNSSFLVWTDSDGNEYYDTTRVNIDDDLTLTAKFITSANIQAFGSVDTSGVFTVSGSAEKATLPRVVSNTGSGNIEVKKLANGTSGSGYAGKQIILPPSVMEIDNSSFKNTTTLEYVVFTSEEAPTNMGTAFNGKTNLSVVNDYCDTSSYAEELSSSYLLVKFVDSDGVSSIYPDVLVKSGNCVVKPDDPTKQGYTFVGWYSDSALTSPYNFSISVTSNITLYAKWTDTPPTPSTNYITFSSDQPFSVSVANASSAPWYDSTGTSKTKGLWYSSDKTTWTKWNGANISSAKGSDDKYHLYFKGNGNTQISSTDSDTYAWGVAGSDVSVEGNILSLLDCTKDYADSKNLKLTSDNSYCFASMFEGCQVLSSVSASFLPATALAESCYDSMFEGCTSLTTAPNLPATTLAEYCYFEMFRGCTKLTTAPELKATTLAANCCDGMFRECTKLSSAPELKATALASGCYQYMFTGCTSLGIKTTPSDATKFFTAPNDPTMDCLNMFQSTAGGPDTPTGGTTYYYYDIDYLTFSGTDVSVNPYHSSQYFTGTGWDGTSPIRQYSINGGTWTDWDASASGHPAIGGTGTSSIRFRGKNCTTGSGNFRPWTVTGSNVEVSGNIMTILDYTKDYALNDNKVIPANSCFCCMFTECTALTNASGLILPATQLKNYCYSVMFSGCTNLISAPELPATQLTDGCYQQMFSGCSSLSTAPELSATDLANSCYYTMFKGCTSLTSAPKLESSGLKNYCYQEMFSGCTNLKVYENTPSTTPSVSGNIFTCHSYSVTDPVKDMFKDINSDSTFKGTPTSNNTYYWYK